MNILYIEALILNNTHFNYIFHQAHLCAQII